MKTASEILKFDFSPASMKTAADKAVHIIKSYEARIDSLKEITRKMGESSFKFNYNNLIPHVFGKFKTIFNSGGSFSNRFERREIRTLTYSLSYSDGSNTAIYIDPNELNSVFEILEMTWRDSYLFGLIDCYLKNWGSVHKSSIDKLGSFIFEKLKRYEGGRSILNSLKSNVKFFDNRKGDFELGYTLALEGKSIKDAADYLSLPDSWFSYSYFSKAILSYYDKQREEVAGFITDLNDALRKHNNSITSKRVISKLIIQVDSSEFARFQDRVKVMAFELIGDPGIASRWSIFDGATEPEKIEIKKAREILNRWITRQFISVFFEKCINDDRRKNFWLKLSKNITAFKVFGPSNIKSELERDERVAKFVGSRFNATSSRMQVSAFFMHVKDFKFIEFGDQGNAFYAYKRGNINSPSMDGSYDKLDSLKDTNLPQLVSRSGYYLHSYYDEGRLRHQDGDMKWEDVFLDWMEKKAQIYV